VSGSSSPKYRRQKRKGGDLAFVELNGVRHYLGRWGTRESRVRYYRRVAEWGANGESRPVAQEEITLEEIWVLPPRTVRDSIVTQVLVIV